MHRHKTGADCSECGYYAPGYGCASPAQAGISTAQLEYSNLQRRLWIEHAIWTRQATISIAEGLADEPQTTARLLRNPDDLAAAFQPFYGAENAGRLRDLIAGHLRIAAELVKAAKAGDQAAATAAENRWYANADAIAAFLSGLNPYWPFESMRNMWHEHLGLVKTQAVERLAKHYEADIAAFNQGEQLLIEMADQIAQGVFMQFPVAFLM